MKSILYVGATLMIGASIYGFVDYKKTSRSKEFATMYEEEKTQEPVVTTSSTADEPAVEKKETNTVAKKTAIKKQADKKIQEEEAIVSIKPIGDNEKVDATEIKEIAPNEVKVKTSKDSGIEKKVTKRRTFSTKLFSRGALDERYIDKKIKTEEIKETKKADVKEQ